MKINNINSNLEVVGVKYFLSAISVFLFIPTFMVYQLLVNYRIIEPVFGGYFTVGMLITFPFNMLLFASSYSFKRLLMTPVFPLFLLFILLACSIAILYGVLGVDVQIVFYTLSSMFGFVAVFLMVFILQSVNVRLVKKLNMFLLIYSLIIVYLGLDGRLEQPAYISATGYYFYFNYQLVALCYLILGLYILPQVEFIKRLSIYFLGIPALYFIGARSEFFAFFLLMAIVEFYRNKASLLLIPVVSALGFLYLFLIDNFDLVSGRMFNVFGGNDASLSERGVLQQNAIKTISNNIFTGGYGSHPLGQYSHNILSLWVDMGLPGMIVFCFSIVLMVLNLLLLKKMAKKSPLWLQAISSSYLVVFMLAVAKTYTYLLVPFAFASYCLYSMLRRNDIHNFYAITATQSKF
ncbi:hypothetical protein [Oligella urethralis]|uniref:Lipid A core - O-antigen ligase and related enzymes n=1 Tax=Oligella urethralis TaxID=90245 RepID=A0A2X1WPR2_9BURK|nr:hypothetical protein [Oligella urethralis]SPY08745.1 Lipid A core - O-antigen ligase and related enzymes [Oligella urethralis]